MATAPKKKTAEKKIPATKKADKAAAPEAAAASSKKGKEGGIPGIRIRLSAFDYRVLDEAAQKIRLGNPVIIRGRDAPVEAEEACATARGRLVAIGTIEAGMFKPKRVFVG